MAVTFTNEARVLTAKIEGEIDHHTARELRESIDTRTEQLHPQRLILDLSGVGFMDSSGIGLIMGRYKLMKELNGDIDVIGASGNIARMIKLAGLSRIGISC